MSLRTTALVAGVIGVLLLAAGLIAESQRPPSDVTAVANVDTAVVVYEPEMIAFAGDFRIGVSGDGAIVAVSARPVDAEAWLADRRATVVTGLPAWETLSTEGIEPAAPSPSPSPSASDEPAAATPTPSPSASAGAEDGAEEEQIDILAETSQDHWRADWRGQGRLSIQASDVPPGETLVVVSEDGSPLTRTDLAVTRNVDDGWITPLIWWGGFLTAVGFVGLIMRFIDLRPAHAKREEWMAKRQRAGEEGQEANPGTRRARRATGEHLPEARLDDDPPGASAGHYGSLDAPGASAPGDHEREERP